MLNAKTLKMSRNKTSFGIITLKNIGCQAKYLLKHGIFAMKQKIQASIEQNE